MHQDREGFESMWWHLAYYNRGVCHGDLEMWDLAIRDLTVALNTKEGDADALNERGYARIKLGDLDGAIADFSEALKNDPHHPKAATNLSLAETQKGIYG
jgi:tetratricopeptide (TPR) repeat protein